MSYSMHQGATSVPPPSHGFGRTFLIGGSVVAATLGVVWIALLRSKERQQCKGTNPIYEQVLAHVTHPNSKSDELPRIRTPESVMPALPVREHHHGKMTLPVFNNSDESRGQTRYSAPQPQRAGNLGEDQAYGKAPDYVKSYGKNKRATEMSKIRALRQNAEV